MYVGRFWVCKWGNLGAGMKDRCLGVMLPQVRLKWAQRRTTRRCAHTWCNGPQVHLSLNWGFSWKSGWSLFLFVVVVMPPFVLEDFRFTLKHWPPLLCLLTLICFIFYINIKSHAPIFHFLALKWKLKWKGSLFTMFDTQILSLLRES